MKAGIDLAMVWYAVRTKPGAQRPQREYWPEPTRPDTRGGGYRIVSSVNPEQSAVELALERGGFTHYMPAEFDVVRNRRKKGLYEVRRFALLKGYLFVTGLSDEDWPRLMSVNGIRGVVGNDGEAMPIGLSDIHRLRMYELSSRIAAKAKAHRLSIAEDRENRKDRRKAIKSAKRKLFPGRQVRLIWGEKVGHDAAVQAWRDQDQVRVLLRNLDASTETITVPYEFLKVHEMGLTGTDA